MIKLIIPGRPLAAPRARHGSFGVYNPKRYMEWKKKVSQQMHIDMKKEDDILWIRKGARIRFEAIFKRPGKAPKGVSISDWNSGLRIRRLSKPDSDNLDKANKDALKEAICKSIEIDDCVFENGNSDRYYAAIGEDEQTILYIEKLED